jgi:hypothetical protein
MATKIGTSRGPKNKHKRGNPHMGVWSAVMRNVVVLANAVGTEGFVTIVVVLGSVIVLAYLNKPEWPLVVLALTGLAVFLLFRILGRRYAPSDSKDGSH